MEQAYFPIFIDLTDKRVVVIGGGVIATRRVQTLCSFGCNIEVIAPEVSDEIKKLAEEKKIVWYARAYQENDVVGATIVVTATNQRMINHQVGLECAKLAIPVSVADSKEESTFYFPGIAKVDSVVVGVTASGTNHHLAKKVTDKIKSVLKSMV
ncbi:precorrin-2 dehydrogenase/sirohydrochlorin ferrochelatase family protein [Anaerosporobacter sp.]|uniref:precorrin-2 dehydrogenase/sirohydrochlorin ferrochelatase family protein n=1 Tax=Anaerosporobacter sp. TaxID=1872529 RepID=UPI00286F1368|nr:bifunctional precorrin-2 dehydrogenase/sirohydrochlorin ferrochelatase [Anaerosporobacter sp.]